MKRSWFKAEWSNTLIASTAVISLVLLVAAALLPGRAFNDPALGAMAMGVLAETTLLLTLLFSYLLSPSGYIIGEDKLTIVRRIRSINIPFTEITGIEGPEPSLTRRSIRLLGSDGLWGRYGRYRNAKLGTYYMYVRSGKAPVLVQGTRKYVVGPERPQEFVQSLNQAVAAAKAGK